MALKSDIALDHIHFRGVEAPARHSRMRSIPGVRTTGARASTTAQRAAESPVQLEPLASWVLERGGVSPAAYKVQPLQRRLPALLRLLRVESPEAGRALLERKPELLGAAVTCLLIGVSSFFRDQAVFDRLRTGVLPELLQKRRGIRLFSAGVSEGHELYSAAILLAEAGALEQSFLLGIDCRSDAIERAARGVFSAQDLAGIDSAVRGRYFRAEGKTWRADARLSAAIAWRCADLVTYMPPVSEVIFFRNVAIYLTEECAAHVWEKLCSALAPGGYLITGKAEIPPPALPLQCMTRSVYQKRKQQYE